MTAADRFNRSGFGRWINSPTGRTFRLVAGTAFLAAGVMLRDSWVGIVLMAWSVLPLTAGAFDVCWISAALRGPLAGRRIRAAQEAVVPATR